MIDDSSTDAVHCGHVVIRKVSPLMIVVEVVIFNVGYEEDCIESTVLSSQVVTVRDSPSRTVVSAVVFPVGFNEKFVAVTRVSEEVAAVGVFSYVTSVDVVEPATLVEGDKVEVCGLVELKFESTLGAAEVVLRLKAVPEGKNTVLKDSI